MFQWIKVFSVFGLVLLILTSAAPGQTEHQHQRQGHHMMGATPLTEPGNAIFGTVQEAIRKLEADPDTDWSNVDMEALRQHLIDMRNVAVYVDVTSREEIDTGLQFRVEATTDPAEASLARVLQAHPKQLKRETGWNMQVDKQYEGYSITVTTENPGEVEKIRGLGYIGLLAYGAHHQQHHWMLLGGENPHK